MTTAGVEPATFRFVPQHLNQCATVVLINTLTGEANLAKTILDTHGFHVELMVEKGQTFYSRIYVCIYIYM